MAYRIPVTKKEVTKMSVGKATGYLWKMDYRKNPDGILCNYQ